MKYYLCCLACMLALMCSAQHPADTLRLYYSVGSAEPQTGLNRLDSVVQAHPHDSITLTLVGYADFLGNAAANQRLSETRAAKARQLIIDKKYLHANITPTAEGRGDRASTPNGSNLGEPYARRVEVRLFYRPFPKKNVPLVEAPAKEEVRTEPPKPEATRPTAKKDIADLDVGEAMAIKGLNFVGGHHILVPGSEASLLSLLETLKKNPAMKVEIQGHVCCTGGKEDGLDLDTGDPKLSENRARAVYNFLVKNGIDPSRLRYRGFGHSKPLVWPELTEEDMQANRRVEIMIIHK